MLDFVQPIALEIILDLALDYDELIWSINDVIGKKKEKEIDMGELILISASDLEAWNFYFF